jgi:Spy/CpxP family protein refolding chaperone
MTRVFALILILATAFVQQGFSQDSSQTSATKASVARGQQHGPMLRSLAAMNLSEDQRKKIIDIRNKAEQETWQLRHDALPTTRSINGLTEAQRVQMNEKLKPQMAELNARITKEVYAVLTPEQQKDLTKRMAIATGQSTAATSGSQEAAGK